MNAIAQPRAEGARGQPPRALSNAELCTELLREVQLSRAQAMALTRLHFALAGGNRRTAMEAMDRLHALDAEAERLASRLPGPPAGDEELAAVSRHLVDQKLAIAFEKLALASSISGPGMVSRAAAPDEELLILSEPVTQAAAEAHPPLAEWPALPQVEPAEWQPFVPLRWRGWLVAALSVMLLAIVTGAMLAIRV
jgi:hypothetical protein